MTLAPTCPAPVPAARPGDARPTRVPALRLLPVPPRDPPSDESPYEESPYEESPYEESPYEEPPYEEPPYEDDAQDERRAAARDGSPAHVRGMGGPNAPGVQGTLALAFTLPGGVPAVPEPSPALRVVAPGGDGEDAFTPRLTPRVALPDPRSWAARFVQALVEVVAGERPNTQLVRWTSTDVHEQLDERVRLLAAAGAPGVRRAPRWLVRSVHVGEPADGVAEVCALVAQAGRHAALALRLEGIDGRWRCTALELGW